MRQEVKIAKMGEPPTMPMLIRRIGRDGEQRPLAAKSADRQREPVTADAIACPRQSSSGGKDSKADAHLNGALTSSSRNNNRWVHLLYTITTSSDVSV
jgi:hypothetical protein